MVSSPVWTTMSFCNSLVMGASILISQSVGAEKQEDIGEYAGAMMKYNNIIPIFLCFFLADISETGIYDSWGIR